MIGTVSDETLGEEMRVTVVATGLGNAKSESADTPTSLRNPVGMPNYRDLDRPTVMRNNATTEEGGDEDGAIGSRLPRHPGVPAPASGLGAPAVVAARPAGAVE